MSKRAPVSQPCPNRVPDTVQMDRVHRVPGLTRRRDTGHGLREQPKRRLFMDRVPGRNVTTSPPGAMA
jgi:hypothetical protein